jgi:hypothetical protein
MQMSLFNLLVLLIYLMPAAWHSMSFQLAADGAMPQGMMQNDTKRYQLHSLWDQVLKCVLF